MNIQKYDSTEYYQNNNPNVHFQQDNKLDISSNTKNYNQNQYKNNNQNESQNQIQNMNSPQLRHQYRQKENDDIITTINRLKTINQNIEEWADIFDVFDIDKKGWISTTNDDIHDLLKYLNIKINEIEVEQLIKENDKYHSGYMTKTEFLEIFSGFGENYDRSDINNELFQAFKIFDDEDTAGLVSNSELIEILTKSGDKIRIIQAIDKKISLDEIAKMLSKKRGTLVPELTMVSIS